ncbi:phosphatidate cytidylyltransferase [Ahniella affigens]|uniref:Phosphatidate cytidylyltransferase n=1 Tax=Ahniella affigens TaxID=2021234 RepID=A0A2P1PQ73_9GAMM|nr:phosphatidate cytidylyltransferase [Ahniella affigens]AVP96982.1 phosphatidate cytidylyltransferase [Ahniella affigens]
MLNWQSYWHSETLRVFLVACAVLTVASSIAMVLRWRIAKGQPHAVIDNLVARINAWWWMVGLLGAAFLFKRDGVIVLFALISFLALREFITLTQTRRGDHAALAVSFFIALPVQFFLIWIEWYGLWSILIPVYAFLLLPILAALSADTTRFLERAAKVQWGLMICVFCLSHVPALVTLEIRDYGTRNLLLIAFLIIVVQGSDVLQYIFGKLFGKHLLAPALSPSKTWEGLIGGILCATALGAALYRLTPFTLLQAASIAFVICLMGFLGGLVMSAIKRDRGVKDWGHLIEGHGGVLDRIDSLVFAAPIYFHVIRFWWT